VDSDGLVAAPVGGRLYLPQSWIDDPQRCAKAGVPPDVGFATKNEIALTLIEQALVDQVVPAPVLGDAAYGNAFAFRAHLRELNLEFFWKCWVYPWMEEARKTGIHSLVRFVRTLKQDLSAVESAVSEPWSNGPVEGQLNRLKMLKRQMYGRAGIELLRARLLPEPAFSGP